MQIYKGLDVATAKVTEEEKDGIKHHLVDICDVDEKFSVADFKKMCYDKIDDITKRGKNAILVGGTGLYVSAVVKNMNFTEENVDEEFRNSLYELSKVKSNEYVYQMLKNIDKKSAENIHPNNLKRVIRAIEIAKSSKLLKSEHMENEEKRLSLDNSKYNFLVFYIDYERDKIYERINKRVDIMIKDGLLDEAKKVYDLKLSKECTCMQSIGYKEFFPYFEGKITLDEAVEKLKLETRKYAKRQETWFKNKLDIIKINGNLEMKEKIDFIMSYINSN